MRPAKIALVVVAMGLASCAGGSREGAPSEGSRPNIVFVLLDDVRYDDVIDHPFVDLPNLTRLTNEGASFQRFFTSAPLCSPSRAIFMTGQYAFHNGIVDNGERAELSHRIVTFPRLLHDAGYHTGFFGKWHMGHEDDSPRPGFDRWVSFVGQGVYFDPDLNVDGTLVKGEGYMTDLLTDHAVSFIGAAPEDEPFLVFVAQKAVHPEILPDYVRTFPPAPGDEGLYGDAEPDHGPSWRAPTTGKPALSRPVDHDDPRSPEGGLPDDVIVNRLRMLSAVDRGVGRLIEALEARGIMDETIFVVTSDQGFFYGEFGLAQERRLAYEPSTHVPLLVRYPALVGAGAAPDALASNVDIAPTLLELGGAPVPADMDGRSLVPVLDGSVESVRDELLVEYYSDQVFPRIQNMGYKALRTNRFKYIRYEELEGMDELYDLDSDPFELDNLLPDRVPAGVLEDLTARMRAVLDGTR
ncbi:MAG: sulfatase-like hydrolase/transferase [Gemmatimonadota bacterium]|nr:sulfatase-like hydrolase/transferase [Gemmatimonadota bacterium]MDH5760051.1 sulfatase-like hydrolase/transferase [Gemmatimonadota bacterium]